MVNLVFHTLWFTIFLFTELFWPPPKSRGLTAHILAMALIMWMRVEQKLFLPHCPALLDSVCS